MSEVEIVPITSIIMITAPLKRKFGLLIDSSLICLTKLQIAVNVVWF